jgi:hypothetical protein
MIGKEVNVFPYLKRCTLDIICGIMSSQSDCWLHFHPLNFDVNRSGYGHPTQRTANDSDYLYAVQRYMLSYKQDVIRIQG